MLDRNDEKGQSWPVPEIAHQPKLDAQGDRTPDTAAGIRNRRAEVVKLIRRFDAKVDNSELGFLIDGYLSLYFSAMILNI